MARESKKSSGVRWRIWLGLAAILAVGASTAMAALKVRRYITTSPQFLLSRDRKDAITIDGIQYASRWRVQHVFADDFDHSVFSVPLDERRRRLLAIDWVEDASISRIWPARLAVHIRERKPIAFVLLRSSVLLIDAHGVLLALPPQARFTFPVLAGIRPDEPQPQRLERVRAFLRVQEDMGYLTRDVSEVNASDPEDIHIVAQVENRAVELILGDANFGRRYQNFLNHYAEIRKRSPEVKVFDLRLDDRITAKE
ncbi:MAG TPA: FtsQ-type POTRA domain-containing protein [Bryobacteraceae bacterium]|nr:FtsQ-type POTRA domain-containing protein [Bryobacteraceae bacterium]